MDVNSAVHYLRTDLCPYAKGYRHFACPRNGEVILKSFVEGLDLWLGGFSPRNGEVILKFIVKKEEKLWQCFSPRNGEVILKATP